MKTTLVALGLVVGLASCSGENKHGATGATEADSPTVAASTEASAATAFADSLAKIPGVNPADAASGRTYAQAVGEWYGSELPSGIKAHPLAEGIWKNYRYVLRGVVASRGRKKVKPEDAKTWDGFPQEAATVAKVLLPLAQDQPAPTSDKAVPQLEGAWSAMSSIARSVERHKMYLDHPETRDRR